MITDPIRQACGRPTWRIGDRRDTDPASAEQSDAKTGEYPSGPATSVDTGDVTGDFRPHETGEDTEPVADSRPEPGHCASRLRRRNRRRAGEHQ